MKPIYITILYIIIHNIDSYSQTSKTQKTFSHADTLRGSITTERIWWDLKQYDLKIKVQPATKYISGYNTITYQVIKPYKTLQIDLQQPLKINKVIQDDAEQEFDVLGNVYYIKLSTPQNIGQTKKLIIHYSGNPLVAQNPPWDGGIVWSEDKNGIPFIASACQGVGASSWYPCKDHLYDEVDNMHISVNVPKNLFEVSNGKLQSIVQEKDSTKTYNWYVQNPINNYAVNFNIADYVSFSEEYKGQKGILNCSYYVLRNNLSKAKQQFKEVSKMLKAFEYWFGPYPFYEDGYKLVEVPYLGMEHQSCVSYGNNYQNGYLGEDISGTGWGLKFDFIIVHESGHEWFGNSITNKDIADMWIHESFTNYSESLFLEYYYGKEAAATYIRGLRQNIQNDIPIIGKYNVNNMGSVDMYYKGANMLHTIRQIVNNDALWKTMLRGINSKFRHSVVTTQQIEQYISKTLGIDLSCVFNQYLRNTEIPVFNYYFKNNKLYFRYTNCINGFSMPLTIKFNGKNINLNPTPTWSSIDNIPKVGKLEIDNNYYINTKEEVTN